MNELLKLWYGIKERCLNTADRSYPNYGGRGISMHEAWIHDFNGFANYIQSNLGPRPEWASLDRIDNNGLYAPGNLRWASRTLQNLNSNRADPNRNIYLKLSGRYNVRIARFGYGSYATFQEAKAVRDYWLGVFAELDALDVIAHQNLD